MGYRRYTPPFMVGDALIEQLRANHARNESERLDNQKLKFLFGIRR